LDLRRRFLEAAGRNATPTIPSVEPFPFIQHPTDPTKLAFVNEGVRLNERLRNALRRNLCVKRLVRLPTKAVKSALDRRDPLTYPLLEWLIEQQGDDLEKLTPANRLYFSQTSYQFVVKKKNSLREAAFSHLRQMYGSKFYFHGSNLGRCHAISHSELRVMSGTNLQVNGVVHGTGLYFTPSSELASQYAEFADSCMPQPSPNISAKTESNFPRSTGSQLRSLFIAEVISHHTNQRIVNQFNQIEIVVTSEELVMKRIYLIYDEVIRPDDVDSESTLVEQEIRRVLNLYNIL